MLNLLTFWIVDDKLNEKSLFVYISLYIFYTELDCCSDCKYAPTLFAPKTLNPNDLLLFKQCRVRVDLMEEKSHLVSRSTLHKWRKLFGI